MNKKISYFKTYTQRMKLSCGPTTILSILEYLAQGSNTILPTLNDLEQECKITSYKGMSPNHYKDILNNYLQPLGYHTIQTVSASFDNIIEKINNNIPVPVFLLVESYKNPNNSVIENMQISHHQYGYHFSSIIGYNNDDNNRPSLLLSNPFGYEEMLTRHEFQQRRGLHDKLLDIHTSNLKRYINKIIKWCRIVKPNTLYLISKKN